MIVVVDGTEIPISPTGLDALRMVRRHDDHEGLGSRSVHAAARQALISRGLIEERPVDDEPEFLVMFTTALGRRLLETVGV